MQEGIRRGDRSPYLPSGVLGDDQDVQESGRPIHEQGNRKNESGRKIIETEHNHRRASKKGCD